jgi:GNAT superfamily N-acetyltransferase
LKTKPKVDIHPVSQKRWSDLESLFGPVGADGGCWCMFWRLRQKDYAQGSREKNKQALKSMVSKGQPTGVLAYIDGQAVGWCGVSPRPAFARLDNSKLIPASSDPATWSIVCLFINRKFRGQRVSTALLNGAVDFARAQGAKDVEAYPLEAHGEKLDAKRAYPGTVAMFRKSGFKPVVETGARSFGFSCWVVRNASS